MGSTIDVKKISSTQSSKEFEHSSKRQEMDKAITQFFEKLSSPSDNFDPEEAFTTLRNYLTNHERILYSTISTLIYARYENNTKFDPSGTLLSNLEALVDYSEKPDNLENQKNTLSKHQNESVLNDTRKSVLKIFDHVTLASHQYEILKQTDDEYDEKFKKRISTYQKEMSKEMNAQMITMVGIFTALAFLVFGSISSLDGIFENIQMPLFKTMSIGLIWGLCVLNTVFVFLYCIGKMTKLSFKSSDEEKISLF